MLATVRGVVHMLYEDEPTTPVTGRTRGEDPDLDEPLSASAPAAT
jgi:hypothetical protein